MMNRFLIWFEIIIGFKKAYNWWYFYSMTGIFTILEFTIIQIEVYI